MEKVLAKDKFIKKKWNGTIVASDKVFEGYERVQFIDDEEFSLRKKLFKQARRGNIKAQKDLKIRYCITAIWNGKEVVKI